MSYCDSKTIYFFKQIRPALPFAMVSVISLLIVHTSVAQEASLPDLVLSDVHIIGRGATSNDPVFAGENVALFVALTNQGGSIASTAQVGIEVKDPNGNTITDALLLSGTALRAAETVTTATAIPLPQNAIPGTYTIDVVADPNSEVAESNESNNTQTVFFFVGLPPGGSLPDLVLSDVHIIGRGATSNDPVFAGENVALFVALTNQGGSIASTAQVGIEVKDPNGNTITDALLLSGTALRAAETVTTATAIPLPQNAIPGTYTIDVVADPNSEVAESNESNNTQTVFFFVGLPPGGSLPDLVLSDVHIIGRGATSNDPVFAGENVALFVALTNQGGSIASTAQVGIEVKDPNGNTITDALLLSGTALRAAETVTTATAIPLPQNAIPGTYTIDVVADPNSEVAESNESNNTQTVFFFVGLSVPSIGQPTTKTQCMNGGWRRFNSPRTFKNQGDCIQFVNTGK